MELRHTGRVNASKNEMLYRSKDFIEYIITASSEFRKLS